MVNKQQQEHKQKLHENTFFQTMKFSQLLHHHNHHKSKTNESDTIDSNNNNNNESKIQQEHHHQHQQQEASQQQRGQRRSSLSDLFRIKQHNSVGGFTSSSISQEPSFEVPLNDSSFASGSDSSSTAPTTPTSTTSYNQTKIYTSKYR